MRPEDRFVQISTGPAEGKVTLGSGFRLSEGVVVTARHVLVPPQGATEDGIAIRGVNEVGWSESDLIWPKTRVLLGEEPDVALLSVRGTSRDADVTTYPIGYVFSEREDPSLRVHAVGYPDFKRNPRDTHQIEARLPFFAGARRHSLELTNVDFNSGVPGARSAADEWGGFSGAPVLANGHLIGVVLAVQREGRYDFRAARLEPLVSDGDFAACLPRTLRRLGNGVAVTQKVPVRLNAAQMLELASLLLRADAMGNSAKRNVIISLLPEDIRLSVNPEGAPISFVVGLLKTCEEVPDGISTLFNVLKMFAPDNVFIGEAATYYRAARNSVQDAHA